MRRRLFVSGVDLSPPCAVDAVEKKQKFACSRHHARECASDQILFGLPEEMTKGRVDMTHDVVGPLDQSHGQRRTLGCAPAAIQQIGGVTVASRFLSHVYSSSAPWTLGSYSFLIGLSALVGTPVSSRS
jgi:hypothetical protein